MVGDGAKVSLESPPPLESAPCPLGCPPGDEAVLTGEDRLHRLPGEFPVVRCRTCGLLRTDPRPTRESIDAYYPADYAPHASPGLPSPNAVRRGVGRIVRAVLRTNSQRIPSQPPGRLLEVGCGSGGFLAAMARQGWVVSGLEFSAAAARRAQALGFSVEVARIEDAADPVRPYDLVAAWMVIEHLHDPLSALRRIRSWLSPGGRLVLSTPNAACWEFAAFREAWWALEIPRHLTHFTPATLRLLLERGGFRVERILYQRDVKNVLGSIGYRLRDRAIGPAALARWLADFPSRRDNLSMLLYPAGFALAALGQTGRMTVWARPHD